MSSGQVRTWRELARGRESNQGVRDKNVDGECEIIGRTWVESGQDVGDDMGKRWTRSKSSLAEERMITR